VSGWLEVIGFLVLLWVVLPVGVLVAYYLGERHEARRHAGRAVVTVPLFDDLGWTDRDEADRMTATEYEAHVQSALRVAKDEPC
jgi:hypothetical protein